MGLSNEILCDGEGCAYCAAMAKDKLGIEYHPQRPETIYEAASRKLRYLHAFNERLLEIRDRTWVERELGDVPVRSALQRQYDSGMWFDRVHGVSFATVPVESLGRDE
jgi:hypothetical protein